MTSYMFVATVVLVLLLLYFILMALLSRIWEDQSPRDKGGEAKTSQADGARVETKKGVGREELLAS